MIWKNYKRFFGFASAALLVSVFGSGLVSQNVSAAEVTNPYGVMAFRSYWSSASGVVNDNAWNSSIGSYPKNILQNVSGQNRRLYGFTIDWNLNDLTSNATKTVTANITLLQSATTGNSFENTGGTIQVNTSTGLKQGSCQFINPTNNDTPHRATWTCTVSVDNFATINNGQVVIGKVRTASIGDTPIATLCGQSIAPDCNGNVDLVEFSYNVNYSNDPNTSILDETLQEQKKQTEELEKQTEIQQETQDYLTDDTPPDVDTDGLPSVGLLPAGPLDSLLGLPITLMTSISTALGGTCEPIEIPLPFVDEDLPIPCFDSIFYTDGFAPLANVIGVAAAAVILYYWLKHLYKKVDRATSLQTNDEDEWGVL